MSHSIMYETERCTAVKVLFPSGRSGITINIYKPYCAFDEEFPAEVNWPAIGGSTAEDTIAFAEALIYCASLAQEMNKK